MLLWYLGGSVLLVALVFRSAGVDYRLVALGSLLPLAVDLPFGHRAFGHALAFGVVLLASVMLTTIGRARLVRRRLLCLPIGVLCGLVLSGAWGGGDGFWWPLRGASFPRDGLVGPAWAVALQELAGLVACWWVVGWFDLYESGPRREFWRSGRLRATP